MLNVKAVEKIAVAGVVNPQTVANTEKFTAPIDLGAYHQAMGVAMIGDEATEAVTFTCYACDAAGANAVVVKACDTLAASAGGNDNKQLVINVRPEEVLATGLQFVKFGLVTDGSTGGPAAVLGLGVDSRFGPVANVTSVVQVKA